MEGKITVTRKRAITRRSFLRRGVGLAALWAWGARLPEAFAKTSEVLPTRPLGQTGLEVTILGFGGAQVGELAEAQGVAVVEAALEAGITYIDTASSYGRSEDWVGRALEGADRSRFVVATKALKRSRGEARWEIERSLKRLKLDRVDLLQLHSVNTPHDLRRIMAEDGVLQVALEFKEAGHVSHIGITGHRRPQVLVEALKEHPFATALIPINPADRHLYDFAAPLAEAARSSGAGLVAMKVVANGALRTEAQTCLRYALGHPVSCAVVGMESAEEVRANVATARAFQALSAEEKARLEERARPMANTDLLWWKR